MAQVKKFDDGGKLIINNKEFSVEQINDYLSSGEFTPQERESLAGVVRAIQNGEDRYLDPNNNSLSGNGNVNEDFVEYFGSEYRANRGRSGWSSKKQNRHANRNSDFTIRDKALAKLGSITKYEDEKTVRATTMSAKPLGKGSGWFYKDGKYVSGPQNITNEKHIRDTFTYLSADDEGKRNWKLSGWGDELESLKNWYSGQSAEELIDRIKTNSLTDIDKEVLYYMGYSPSETDLQSDLYAKEKEKFSNAGYDYDQWKNIISINDKGEAELLKGSDGQTAFSSLGGNGNYFFNEGFFRSGENNHLSFLKDHFVINGKVYKARDAKIQGSELYNTLRSPGGFYDKNKFGDWEGANSLIRYLWNDETNYALGSDPTDAYVEFLHKNPNIRWRAITGAYNFPLKPGEQVIEYYNPEIVNEYGYSDPKWAILDQNGRFLRYADARGSATGKEATPVSGRAIARTQSGNSIYDGLVIYDLVDSAGNYMARLYKNPVNGDTIYEGELDATNAEGNYKIPHDISDILNKYGNRVWEKIMADSDLVDKFRCTLGNTVNSGFRDNLVDDEGDIMSVEDWTRAGLTYEDAKLIYDKFNWYALEKNQGDMDERRAKRMVATPTLLKSGGNINKFQPGGAVGTNQSVGHTQYTLDTTYDNPEEAARIGKDKFSTADWLDLTALVANGVGVGLGVSGAPIASGVAGVVGTGATLWSDIERDGMDWGDWGDFAINLGLDVVSLIPFGGSVGQSGKIVNGIRKMVPTVTKLFGMMGVGQGIRTAFDKIVNGDDWTVRDVSTVLNAISGGITMAKSGVRGAKRPTATSNEVEVKVKGKTKKVVLTDPEIKKINDANDKGKTLTDIVSSKYKVKADDVDVSESLISRTINPKTWFKKGDLKVNETEAPVSWRKSIKTDGNAFTRWWSGRGYNQAQYNEFLRTGQWKEIKHSSTPEFSKGDVKPDGWKDVKEVKTTKKVKNPSTGKVETKTEVIGYRGKAPKETNSTTVLREGFKNSWNPWKITPRQRQVLRKAAVFTPNYVSRDTVTNELPAGYIPIPIPVVQTDLASRERFKKGGILKAQPGDTIPQTNDTIPLPFVTIPQPGDTIPLSAPVTVPLPPRETPQYDPNKAIAEEREVLLKRMEEKRKALEKDAQMRGKTISGMVTTPIGRQLITPEMKQEWKTGYESALRDAIERGLEGFEYDGLVYLNPTIHPTTDYDPSKDMNIPTTEKMLEFYKGAPLTIGEKVRAGLLSDTETAPYKRTAEEVMAGYQNPEYMNDYEANEYDSGNGTIGARVGIVAEPSLRSQLESDKLLKTHDKWSKKGARHAAREARRAAGNVPGEGGNSGEKNISDVFRAGKLAAGFVADKAQRGLNRQVLANTLLSLPSNEAEYYDRFTDYGLGQQYKQAALEYRKPFVDPNADAFGSMQTQKARNDAATKFDLEGGMKVSQLNSDFGETGITAKRGYAAKQSALEKDSRTKTAAAYNGFLTNEGKSIAQRQNIMDNYVTEQLGLYNMDRNMNFALANQSEQLRYATDVANLRSKYQLKLNADISAGLLPEGTTLEDYFGSNPDKYQEYMNSLDVLQNNSMKRGMDNYRRYNRQSSYSGNPVLAKKGGKVGSKQRSTTDQIWINNQKIHADAVKQLSKEAFEFLKMALS